MSTKKYEFTGETMTLLNGAVLHRIRLLVDIIENGITFYKAGSLGGWIEKEENLSQDGNAWVYGDARVSGNARVSGDAEVSGDARVSGNAEVYGNAWVCLPNHIFVVGPIGSRVAYTTFFRNSDDGISVICGCFLGTIDEFLNKIEFTHGGSKHAVVYEAAANLARLQILN